MHITMKCSIVVGDIVKMGTNEEIILIGIVLEARAIYFIKLQDGNKLLKKLDS